jgi:hypothetical protein
MTDAVRFPFVDTDPSLPAGASLMPLMPLTLSHNGREATTMGLVDSGAAVNVMPYSLGDQLGFAWDQQRTQIRLTGNLAQLPARGVVVLASVAHFPPVRLAFAWTQADDVRLILGQANFLMEFDVCFFRSRSEFDVRPKQVS